MSKSTPIPPNRQEVTDLLIAWRGGDAGALSALLPMVYRELKQIATRFLRGERDHRSLETTALVHEAYLRLIEIDRVQWQDRSHFFAVTSQLMRRVLVDQARHHQRIKRGGGMVFLQLDEGSDLPADRTLDLLALDDALKDLADADAEMARLVELRFFGGLSRDEMAEVTGLSSATVTRRWRTARAWLARHLTQDRGDRAPWR